MRNERTHLFIRNLHSKMLLEWVKLTNCVTYRAFPQASSHFLRFCQSRRWHLKLCLITLIDKHARWHSRLNLLITDNHLLLLIPLVLVLLVLPNLGSQHLILCRVHRFRLEFPGLGGCGTLENDWFELECLLHETDDFGHKDTLLRIIRPAHFLQTSNDYCHIVSRRTTR